MKELLQNLIHPYSRYGLAIALFEAHMSLDDLTRENVSEVLAQAIEAGIENFRLMTDDNPETAEVLRFRPIKYSEFQKNPKLVRDAGLASQGKYIAPTVITTDKEVKGTFDNAVEIIESLRKPISLTKTQDLSRSFAPTTAKINNGTSSQSPPKGTLFECACNAITTLTHIKPAFIVNVSKKEGKVELRNTTVIPDLSLGELRVFINVFEQMRIRAVREDAYITKLDKQSGDKKFSRPKIFNGNYPFAPRETAFGAVGLLAAIGKWGERARDIERAAEVLQLLEGRPLYVINYENISQVQFTHHVVKLAVSGKLSDIISAFSYQTQLYADTENKNPDRYNSNFTTNYKLLKLMTNRFLQFFNQSAFQDFLAIRAEYLPIVEPIFKEYFMAKQNISREIVESAQAMGQWLNRMAYFVAKENVESEKTLSEPDKAKKIRQVKSKILTEIESAVMSAKTPYEMFSLTNIRAVRLSNEEAPAQSAVFMNEANVGENITLKDAKHLLTAYLRLRQNFEKFDKATNEEVQSDTIAAEQLSSNSFNTDLVA
jgi:hypothetical protein